MQINISSKHIDMTPTIEEYIRSKAEKLHRYFNRIEQIEVKIEKSTHGFIAEIISDIEHHDNIVGNSENEDLYVAIDSCIDRSVRQLTDLKNKIRDHHHKNKHHFGDREI